MEYRWSRWRAFPDPRKGGILHAPIGPGVYQLRNRSTGQLVLIGIGRSCAYRVSSLLPKPWGAGTRNNAAKRRYLLRQLKAIEYRTLACATRDEARAIEKRMLKQAYRFGT